MFVRTITSMFGRAALGQSLAKFSSKAASAVTIAALLLSGIPFQFAAAATGVTLFNDGFEGAGDFTGWDEAATKWSEQGGDTHTGDRRAEVKGSTTGTLRKAVSTAGYENITLSYWYKVSSKTEAADHVYVEWFDGSVWTEVADYTDLGTTGWLLGSHTLPTEAEDNASFQFRLRTDLGAGNDEMRFDDFLLTGDTLPEPPACSDTTFDTFSLGSVNGQGGWSATGPFDQEVVTNTYAHTPDFGCQTLRISNAVTSGSFGDQTFAAPVGVATGESSVATNNHFEAQFDIASTKTDEQSGMFLSVSPDDGSGSRMSYLSFTDAPAGIDVTFYDVVNAGPLPTVSSFVPTSLGTLDRSEAHTIRFAIDFVDGPHNDVVEIYIDDVLVHTGTTWEDYYRFDPEQTGNGNALFPVDTLIFRASGTAVPGNDGEGFLFDNFDLASDLVPNEPPPTPTHLSPADGSIFVVGALGNIDWTDEVDPPGPGAGAVTYVYQSSHSASVDEGGALVSPLYTSAPLGVSQINAAGTPAGVYYWQVKAVDPQGNESAWSEPWKITVSDTPATLIVEKVVVNDHGGSAVVGDFSYSLNGDDPVAFVEDGATYELSNENYSVQEVAVIGYEATFSEDCEGTLAPGETKTCTVTNDDIPAAFTLVKETIGDDDEFTLVVGDGSATTSAVLATENGTATTLEPIEVSAGTYYVGEETLPEGWDYTSISCEGASGAVYESGYGAMVGVSVGDEVTCTVTNTARATLEITKYSDPAVGEFKFDLTGPEQEGIPAEHTFAPEGVWSDIPFLLAGSYSLSETIVSPEDWTGTQLIACVGAGENNPEGSIASPFGIELSPGEDMSCFVNNTQDALLTGKKFRDEDGTGESLDGAGLKNWDITIVQIDNPETEEDEGGLVNTTMATGKGGVYSFKVQPGTYRICETQKNNWYQSYPYAETDYATSACEDGNGYELTVVAGEIVNGLDFGNYKLATVSGNKFEDLDGNGEWGEDEPGIQGIRLYVDTNNNQQYDDGEPTDLTNNAGAYKINGIEPGTYDVREDLSDESDWVQTAPEAGSFEVLFTSHDKLGPYNFGNMHGGYITGVKWQDDNNDGEWGEDESAPNESFMLRLYRVVDESEVHVANTTTNEDGTYSFGPLTAGTYRIYEVSEAGWMQTYPSETEYHEVVIAIDEGTVESSEGHHFGNISVTTLSGAKWHDRDQDGYWGEGEYGIDGWMITATPLIEVEEEVTESEESEGPDLQIFDLGPLEPTFEEDTEGSRSTKTTETDESGNYDFNFLANEEGWWLITEESREYWSQTYPIGPAQYPGQYVVYISPEGGDSYGGDYDEGYSEEENLYEYYDFGNWEWPYLYVFKWKDDNQDGIRNWTDLDEEGNTEGVKDENEVFTEDPVEGWPMVLARLNQTQSEEEETDNVDIEIVALSLTGADGMAVLRAPDYDDFVVFEGAHPDWTTVYPFTHQSLIIPQFPQSSAHTLLFPDSIPEVPLNVDSFFDVFVNVEHVSGGDDVLVGFATSTEDADPVNIEFGNFYTAPEVPPTDDNTESSGGGGGGNGPISGSFGFFTGGGSTGQVLGVSTVNPNANITPAAPNGGQCVDGAYITGFMGPNRANDPDQVLRLQVVLQAQGYDVDLSSVFDTKTFEAVKQFQLDNAADILAPWGITEPTGYVYLTTRKKLNELYCAQEFPLTPQEQAIVNGFGTGGSTGDTGGGSTPSGNTGSTSGGGTLPTEPTEPTEPTGDTGEQNTDGDNTGTGEGEEGEGSTGGGIWNSIKGFFGQFFR